MLRRAIISLGVSAAVMLLAAAGPVRYRYVVAFYNLENLFDTLNDPATWDEDMLPLSDRAWNSAKYRAKLSALARVIADIGAAEGFPAVLGVTEAETRGVLEDLAAQPAVASAGYAVCHYDSPDERGIDVGFLYRPDLFAIEGSRAFRAANDSDIRSRDHVAMWGTMGGERIFFMAVHWPSRRAGVEFTAPLREACARRVRAIVDSVRRADPTMKIVVMGDMNDNPSDRSVAEVFGASGREKGLHPFSLFNPFAALKRAGEGTTVYDGRWNMYDNIAVSADLVASGQAGLHLCTVGGSKRRGAIFVRDYMLSRRGWPRPTFLGTEYVGGASDHLPIYIVICRE